TGEDRQLSFERALEGRPRLAARDIGCEVWMLAEQVRSAQPAKHRHHQEVARAERALEPLAIAQAAGELAQAHARDRREGEGAARARARRARGAWPARARRSAAPSC